MGRFDIIQADRTGRIVAKQSAINHIMYGSHAIALRKILPTQSGTLTWRMGFSGPQWAISKETAPNGSSSIEYTFDRRGTLFEYTFNEGAAPAEDMRLLFGYERKEITWTVEKTGSNIIIDSGQQYWYNQVTWDQHGDWTPDDWDEETQGTYPQPYKYYNPITEEFTCKDYEEDQGYPWCVPVVRDDDDAHSWWKHNEFEIDCGTCRGHNLLSISGYPVGCCFITVEVAGSEEGEVLFAAGLFNGPIHWRPSDFIYARYTGVLF